MIAAGHNPTEAVNGAPGVKTGEATTSSAPRRPWHRPHRSTWIVLALAAVALVILIVPGEIQSGSQGSYGLYEYLNHGWPWPYVQRMRHFPFPARHTDLWPGPAWIMPWAWSYEGVERFSLLNLVLDVLVALLLLALLAIAVEFRRRCYNPRIATP